jgi:hypothetical protein
MLREYASAMSLAACFWEPYGLHHPLLKVNVAQFKSWQAKLRVLTSQT